MGQKTNPIGLRLGIIRGWDSNWFGGRNFGAKLAEDNQTVIGAIIAFEDDLRIRRDLSVTNNIGLNLRCSF